MLGRVRGLHGGQAVVVVTDMWASQDARCGMLVHATAVQSANRDSVLLF
jgi:hypothetical protein